MKKHIIFFTAAILLFISLPANAEDAGDEQVYPVRAKVIELLENYGDEETSLGGGFYIENQYVKVMITEGEHRGKTIVAEHSANAYFSDYEYYRLKKGDSVFVTYNTDERGRITDAYVTDLVREGYIYFLLVLFFLLILVLGRGQGFKTILTLIFTVFVVIKVLIPLILKGFPPVITAVVLCSGVIIVCFVVISGWRIKTLAAVLGTVAGVITAGAFALIIGSAARLTGLAQEETVMLMNIPQEVRFNFQGLLFAGIIIGAMGAVMDVGMSIASSLNEIRENNPEINFRQLIRSGMNVGRDVMGTMTNTLVLAYTGGALNIMILFTAYKVPIAQVINGDFMASEIVRALAGSIGLVLTIPVTTLISAWLYSSRLFDKIEGSAG
ncbi:MAG: YibE/F family protein [Clostridiaceae bacterium]|nr:YibE/F family protein [Clostridiaceae bacterium]